MSEMDNNDLFRDIPKTRHDETCPNGCHSHLLMVGGYSSRKVGENLVQSLWKCKNCGELVVQLDEIDSEECPLCGGSGSLTPSRLKEYRNRNTDE
jgi:predicted Zn-ribbon and HTH transcriptional regulator